MRKLFWTGVLWGLVGWGAMAQAGGGDKARLQYVGGFTICAKDAAKLAAWYEKFGLQTKHYPELAGYFGGFKWEGVDFHFGIYPVAAGSPYCPVSAASYGLTFRVNDLEGYLKGLGERGLKPAERMETAEGKFAIFRDPENHLVSIWGVD